MNKSKRMAGLKRKKHQKKLKERRKAIALASGLPLTEIKSKAKPVPESIQPVEIEEPKKKAVKKTKSEAEAPLAEVAVADTAVEAAPEETPPEPKKRAVRKKKTETEAPQAEVTEEPKKKTVRKKKTDTETSS